jgi:glycosyltransferase involved in cell wall biosynthesis
MGERIAVVSATAGDTVGGHETVLREMAEGLAQRGFDVDLLTSAADSIYTWENVAPLGVTIEGPLTVHRFEAVGLTQPDRDRLGARILGGDRLEIADQYRWVNSGMRMPGLYSYLTDHADEYRAIICGPYMFWASLVLADVAPERTIILPALHDEPFARLDVYRYQMRNVRGLWFETQPEMALARSLDLIGDGFELVGSAVDIPHGIDIEGFRNKFGIDGDYLFYAGRREWGKGWPALLDDLAFADEVLGKSLPLVTYIQPSALEAFSRTVVEALSLGTPVVANWHSAVVRWHCERSGGGLTYKNRYEFTECVRIVRDEPEIMAEIGRSGPAYVREHFNWPAVLDRAERTIGEWF